jgi:hypothetical protein
MKDKKKIVGTRGQYDIVSRKRGDITTYEIRQRRNRKLGIPSKLMETCKTWGEVLGKIFSYQK